MNWLDPMAGVWLALAVIPPLILLYFLKLRRRQQAVSCTILWKRSVEDLRANAPFQKLRRSLLLFLQLLALALLALSLAQPQIHAGQQSGGKSVIMIDNSASMTSTNVSPTSKEATRLDEAKRRAKEKIEAMYGGGLFGGDAGETMIVVFSDRAEVFSRFTRSKQQLLAAIDRIPPTHGETRIDEALKLARAFTVDPNPEAMNRLIADPPTIELYSDGRIADLKQHVLRGEAMNYHAIGNTTANNVAISSISVERPFDRPDSIEVFVALLNFNKEPVTCDMQLSVNDRARGIQEARLPAAEVNPVTNELMPGRSNVVFQPFEQPRGAVIEIANLRADDLQADNVAQVVVAPPVQLSVALVASSPSILTKAMSKQSMRLARLDSITPADYETLAQNGGLAEYDVVVLENYLPQSMPPGRYLTFGPTPPVEGLNDYGEGKSQIILNGKDDHPVLRMVPHDNIVIHSFRLLQPAPDVQVLLEGTRGPALVAVSRGPMQVLHCPFSPLDSNWPFERSFVNFLVNAVEYLGHSGEAITSRSLSPGEAITARLPAQAQDIQLFTPGQTVPQPLSPQDPQQFAWGPAMLAGPYLLTWRTPDSTEVQSRAFAVNLLSEIEGRIDVNPVLEVGQDRVAGRRVDESAYTPLWPWAIGLCLTVLMLEWWVYHRKAYI